MALDRSEYAVLDIEIYWNYFLICIRRLSDGKVFIYEMRSDDDPVDWGHLTKVLRKYKIITFNGLTFDIPLVFLAMAGASISQLKEAANRIIEGGLRFWEVENVLGVKVPKWLDHIDLMEPNPAVRQGLKVLNGRLHGRWMQELPYHHASTLTEDQMDFVRTYCINDLDATELLFNALMDGMELREQMSKEVGTDLRSKSDTQMGFAIIKKRVEDLRGNRLQKSEAKLGQSFNYVPPSYITFKDANMNALLERIRQHRFTTSKDGKVELPDWLLEPIHLHGGEYQMGIGGLHSTEANRAIVPAADEAMQDHDVNSMYPSLILSQGLFPKALGKDFLTVYEGIYRDRLAAKAAKNKLIDKSLKLALNGSFGLLGNRWSPLYAPNLLIAVTITGQLSLLMIIEMFELAGIKVVSANTDGVVTFTKKHNTAPVEKGRVGPSKLQSVIEAWEALTGMTMESAEYTALYNQSVNSYIALKPDGTHKRKGPLGNPWSHEPFENDVRSQMMKSPAMTICSDAALYFLKNGTPIEETIRNCKDVRQFISVITATGGATWRDEYLGKVVRYYWSKDGDPIVKVKAHAKTGNRPKVPKTEGSKPLMTLPDDYALPADVDYERYICETRKILKEIGFTTNTIQRKVDHPYIRLARR